MPRLRRWILPAECARRRGITASEGASRERVHIANAVARLECPVWLCQTGRYTNHCNGWRTEVRRYKVNGNAAVGLLFAAVSAEAAYFCAGDCDFYAAVARDLIL